MLKITVPPFELFDSQNNEFIQVKSQTLQLEHSLVSISKWEQKWHKPFLSRDEKTTDELLDYIRCMTITQNVNPLVYVGIDNQIMNQIIDYIDDSNTATWFRDDGHTSKQREIITSEIIYYWMISLNIPPEYQKWHLNRLLTLIRVCNEKNTPPKKMSSKEIAQRNRKLNEARKQALRTHG